MEQSRSEQHWLNSLAWPRQQDVRKVMHEIRLLADEHQEDGRRWASLDGGNFPAFCAIAARAFLSAIESGCRPSEAEAHARREARASGIRGQFSLLKIDGHIKDCREAVALAGCG